jgi:hypothetical protein
VYEKLIEMKKIIELRRNHKRKEKKRKNVPLVRASPGARGRAPLVPVGITN